MLKTLEDDLLSRLSSAGGNILGDTALVENLETTKRTAADIEQKVAEARITSAKIDQARELYRPAAARASLLYFILNDLNTINPIYQFSLKVFVLHAKYDCMKLWKNNSYIFIEKWNWDGVVTIMTKLWAGQLRIPVSILPKCAV
jgi:hypothetical protein